jgi:predicted Zn finger-like uncharacterized protein
MRGEPASLFTQCSKCETVFRLSAEVLRAAGGQVRCGRCGEVFNALARLAEDATAFTAGESSLELEARADHILQEPSEPPAAGPAEPGAPLEPESVEPADLEEFDEPAPGVEVAHLQLLDSLEDRVALQEPEDSDDSDDSDDDTSMEYTLPPGELDRIFVESRPRIVPPLVVEPVVETADPSDSPHITVSTVSTVSAVSAASADSPDDAKSLDDTADTGSTDEAVGTGSGTGNMGNIAATGSTTADIRRRLTGIEVPDEVRRDMLEVYEKSLPQNEAPTRDFGPVLIWLGVALALLILLAAQFVQQNRDRMESHPPQSAALRAIYSMLGFAAPGAANLSAYQLRQWGVTGDPSANGTLRVRASILNTAALPQPYPLLRVMLANRFGTSIGTREFEPAEYLGKAPEGMLGPGKRIDASLDILDPGKNAEGFEIDVCLRGANGRIACANDAAAQPKS